MSEEQVEAYKQDPVANPKGNKINESKSAKLLKMERSTVLVKDSIMNNPLKLFELEESKLTI